MSALDNFLAQKRRWHTISRADLDQAANGVILALDGKVSRSDAKMIARMAFESVGMEVVATIPDLIERSREHDRRALAALRDAP